VEQPVVAAEALRLATTTGRRPVFAQYFKVLPVL
jgi:hypothetical protein